MKICYTFISSIFIGIGVIVFFLTIRLQQNCIRNWRDKANKNRALFIILDQWVSIKQEGKKLETYFERNNYKRIAIYGMSYLGVRLVKELKNSNTEILYGIDRNAGSIDSNIKIVTIDDDLPNVDAVVVTLVAGFDAVCDALTLKLDCPIIGIEDVLNEI